VSECDNLTPAALFEEVKAAKLRIGACVCVYV
jgi:hypothetical protein